MGHSGARFSIKEEFPSLKPAKRALNFSIVAMCCALLQVPLQGAFGSDANGPTFSTTHQSSSSTWSVIAYGDTRFTDPSNVTAVNPKVRRWLVQKIADEAPDAILLSGDLPYTGSDPGDYAVFRDETKSWRDRQIHFYPALGNHELKGGEDLGLSNWWKSFPELKGRRWYSVAFRNAYFICLDTDVSLDEGSEQRTWFDKQISRLPAEMQFVFIVQHHPPLADLPMDPGHTPKPNEVGFARHLEEESAHLPVHFVVIAGHIHNYERFQQRGIDFLISGGGGANPHPVPRGNEDFYKDPGLPNYHFLKFEFDGIRIRASMIRLLNPDAAKPEWEIKDRFVIEPVSPKSATLASNTGVPGRGRRAPHPGRVAIAEVANSLEH